MPFRFLIAPALLIAAALPALAQTDTPDDYVAPPVIWVDSFEDIPEPRPVACIGNSSVTSCRGPDGQTYSFPTGSYAFGQGLGTQAPFVHGTYHAPSAGGAGIYRE